jgi:peptidoglycan/xylan/chitin deacetylase (PgdA/CDA1 family)
MTSALRQPPPSAFILGLLAVSGFCVTACGPAGSSPPAGDTGSGGTVVGNGGSSGSGGGRSGQGTGGANPGSGGAGTGGAVLPPAGTITDPPCSTQVDSQAPSIDPPGGLAAARVPMFIMLGFDDNGYADGINWTLDTLRTRKNADGTAALATFFISGGFASEFFNNAGGQTEAQLLASWKRMKAEGHEIGNHSWSHGESLQGAAKEVWQAEITKANDLFVNTLGVERCKLGGFRTPFLAFSQNTFDAMKGAGMHYDTSVEFGYDWWQPLGSDKGWGPGTLDSGKHYYWPFTMDAAFPAGFASKGVGTSPGIWEFPVYTFNKITGDTAATVTGFDFNLWTKNQNEPTFAFADVLKQSLDQRLAGNRSPFAIGVHTDIYAQFNEAANTTWTMFNYQARRKALSDFIDYALAKPEVRLITYRQMIDWMRHPTSL